MKNVLLLVLILSCSSPLTAQNHQDQSSQQPANGRQNKQQQNPNSTPDAGGPQDDLVPIAVPEKEEEELQKDQAPAKPKKVEGMPDFSISVIVPVVTLEVGVLSKDGIFIPGLRQGNFRVLEDGVPQQITSFNQTQGSITAVILTELANNQYFYNFQIDSINASFVFTQTLKKEDWVALITYDTRAHILQDFTQDKRAIQGSASMLQPGMAMSQETNLFDALYDTIDRLETVEGRKFIILVSSGRDTFSRKTLDQCLKKVQESKDIAIYSIGTGQALRNYAESHGYMQNLCPITDSSCSQTFVAADHQMRAFAKMTGGKSYFPLFPAQFREIFGDIGQAIRNQYSISYHPTNRAEDGSFRKITVELVDETGKPLRMRDEKGKDVKYLIIAREGYKAKQQVE
jgi:VWFA-related protein